MDCRCTQRRGPAKIQYQRTPPKNGIRNVGHILRNPKYCFPELIKKGKWWKIWKEKVFVAIQF